MQDAAILEVLIYKVELLIYEIELIFKYILK